MVSQSVKRIRYWNIFESWIIFDSTCSVLPASFVHRAQFGAVPLRPSVSVPLMSGEGRGWCRAAGALLKAASCSRKYFECSRFSLNFISFHFILKNFLLKNIYLFKFTYKLSYSFFDPQILKQNWYFREDGPYLFWHFMSFPRSRGTQLW